MSTPGNYPYLEYTIVPSPLILNQPQDIIIIATLKTTAENQGSLSSVTVNNIVIDFGGAGPGATDLTPATKPGSTWSFHKDSLWNIASGGGTGVNSLTVTPQQDTNGQVKHNAIFIKITGVHVNDTKGNVNVTITETVSEVNGASPGNYGVNEASLVLPKIDGQSSAKITFTASHHYINTGNQPNVKLKWDGPAGPSYSLHYLDKDQLINVPVKNADGSEGNLGNKSSYTLYPAGSPNITPSNTQGFMPKETTDFILRIKEGEDTITYLTLTVIVEGSHLYASGVTINGHDETAILHIKSDQQNAQVELTNSLGTWTIQTGYGNLLIQNPQGAKLQLSPKGELTVNGGINVTGDSTITGNLTVTKDLTVNENSTVGGNSNVKGRGGKTYVGTLDSNNGYCIENLFTTDYIQAFNYYELVFNSIVPFTDNDKSFGARFYCTDNGITFGMNTKIYSGVYIGNDSGEHGFGFYKEKDYQSLWPNDRSGPADGYGLLGTMTIFRTNTFGCIATLYAPNTFGNVGCQVWVEGTMNGLRVPANAISGIGFNFFDSSNLAPGGGIAYGYIDVYGWN